MSDNFKDAIALKLVKVNNELSISDPIFMKRKCPLCHGLGVVSGKLAGPNFKINQNGKCRYCNGVGIAKVRKKFL